MINLNIKVTLILFFVLSITTKANANADADKSANFFKDNKTTIKNPFELRDPFKRKRLKLKSRRKAYSGYLENNSYSNLPSINTTPLNQIRIIGVLLGKDRRAIAKILNGSGKLSDDSFILKEGMKLGENESEIKAIVPGGIVLVEKIRNVYDQDEYIETIIPVSSDTSGN